MNNSLNFEPEFPKETIDSTVLREREAKLVRLLEVVQTFGREWSTLREEMFEGRLEQLEKLLVLESKKPEVNLPELYRLQGRLGEVRRIVNFIEAAPHELAEIRKRLNPPGPTG